MANNREICEQSIARSKKNREQRTTNRSRNEQTMRTTKRCIGERRDGSYPCTFRCRPTWSKLGDDSSESCEGDLGLAGKGGGCGGWDDWGGGGYKEGEAWTRGKKERRGSDLGAPPQERKKTMRCPSHGPWFFCLFS